MLIPKQEIIRSTKHRKWVRSLWCCYCGSSPSEAAHIRIGTSAGIGIKPSDKFIIPLCRKCHSRQHQHGELSFHYCLEDAKILANSLYEITGNSDLGNEIVRRYYESLPNMFKGAY